MSTTETLAPPPSKVSPKKNGTVYEIKQSSPSPEWKGYEKILFRFVAIYFFIQAVPLDWKYYRDVFSANWFSPHYRDIFYLAHYSPRVFSNVPVFADWAVIAAIALAGTALWTVLDKKSKEYTSLYYGLRVILRYRLAIALLAYGFLKFFPQQMPEPSISSLNTNYGDITNWKVFSLSTGIVSGYEAFLGFIEITAALLLLNRKTTWLGAFIIIPFAGNVFLSNLAYEGGEYVYSFGLIGFASFLLVYDVKRLIELTSFEQTTEPDHYKPVFAGWQKNTRLALKSFVILFFVGVYGYKTYAGQFNDPYQYPKTPGLADAAGVYNVTTFSVNNHELPYSTTDPIRWKDVVFEKWNTISIRSNKPVTISTATTEELFLQDKDRNYEFAGSAGRHYYTYSTDSIQHVLTLQNRNPNHTEKLVLHYERNGDAITLTGIDEQSDSLQVVLNKVDRKYVLEEAKKTGRGRGLKL
jgi:hypothetical protein